jgi:hypothetical protein
MTVEIPLSQGLRSFVDDADAEALLPFRWRVQRGGRTCYAYAFIDGRSISMHRHILNLSTGQMVDHADGNGLNNTRSNLRLCSHAENIRNSKKQVDTTSVFKGVRLAKSGFWRAQIQQNGQRIHLGYFESEVAAARQYDRAARVFFGRFAKTNDSLGLLDAPKDRRRKRRVEKPARVDHEWRQKMVRIGIVPRLAGSK